MKNRPQIYAQAFEDIAYQIDNDLHGGDSEAMLSHIRHTVATAKAQAAEAEAGITIRKRGIPPSQVRFEGTCSTCQTEVDFPKGRATQEQDRNFTLYKIACPVCGSFIYGNPK